MKLLDSLTSVRLVFNWYFIFSETYSCDCMHGKLKEMANEWESIEQLQQCKDSYACFEVESQLGILLISPWIIDAQYENQKLIADVQADLSLY